MNDKDLINKKKMEVLMGLRGFAMVKLTETQALWKIFSEDSLTIDVSFPSELWETKHKGKTIGNWKKDTNLPANVRGMIQSLEDDFEKACEEVDIIIDSGGKDQILPERLEELRKEFNENLEPKETESNVAPVKSLPAEPTQKDPIEKDPIDQLIEMLGKLLEIPTDPSFTRHCIKNEEVAA